MKRVRRIKASVVQVCASLARSQVLSWAGQSLKGVSGMEQILKLSDCLGREGGREGGK